MKKLQKKSYKKIYKLDIYGTEVHVLVDYDYKKFLKEYTYCDNTPIDADRIKDLFSTAGCYAGWYRLKKAGKDWAPVCILRVETDLPKSFIINTLAHEAFHITNMQMSTIDCKLDDNDEPWAYMVGYLTECAYKAVFEKK